MKSSSATGVATIGAAGVEAIHDAAAETQVALQPLIPYLDMIRWFFIAAALGNLSRFSPKDPIETTG